MKRVDHRITPTVPFPSNPVVLGTMIDGLINEVVLDILKKASLRWSDWKVCILVSRNWKMIIESNSQTLFDPDIKKKILETVGHITLFIKSCPLINKNLELQESTFQQLILTAESVNGLKNNSIVLEYIQNEQKLHSSINSAYQFLCCNGIGGGIPMSHMIFKSFISFTGVESTIDIEALEDNTTELYRHLIKNKCWEAAFFLAEHVSGEEDLEQGFCALFDLILLEESWNTAMDIVCNILSKKRQCLALKGLIQASINNPELSNLISIQKWLIEMDALINQIQVTQYAPIEEIKTEMVAQALSLAADIWVEGIHNEADAEFESFILSLFKTYNIPIDGNELIIKKINAYLNEIEEINEALEEKIFKFFNVFHIEFKRKLLSNFFSKLFNDVAETQYENFPLSEGHWKMMWKLKNEAEPDATFAHILLPFIYFGLTNSADLIKKLEKPENEFDDFPILFAQVLKEQPSFVYFILKNKIKFGGIDNEQEISRLYKHAKKIIIAIAKILLEQGEKETIMKIIECNPNKDDAFDEKMILLFFNEMI
jgi:hypothetical protein